MSKRIKNYFNVTIGKCVTSKPKTAAEWAEANPYFHTERVELYNFYENVCENGLMWCRGTHSELNSDGCTPKNNNWINQQVLALDFDKGDFVPTELYEFYKGIGIAPTFGYYTFSDGKINEDGSTQRKCRLVWVLTEAIDDPALCKGLNDVLAHIATKYPSTHKIEVDKNCNDLRRVFQGSNKGGFGFNNKLTSLSDIQRCLANYLSDDEKQLLNKQYSAHRTAIKKQSEQDGDNYRRPKTVQNAKLQRVSLKKAADYAQKVTGRTNGTDFTQKFSAMANQFGCSLEETLAYFTANHNSDNADYKRISDIFNRYQSQWGSKRLQIGLDGKIVSTLQLPNGKKLSDLSEDLSGLMTKPSVVVSPTGSGKTFWVAKMANEKNKIVMVQPTLSLVKESALQYGGVAFYEKQRLPLGQNLVFCTYASYQKLVDSTLFRKNEYTLFVDEAHNFTASASLTFQFKALNSIIKSLDKWKSYHFVTATPLFNTNKTISNMQMIKVEQPTTTQKNIFVVKTTDFKAAVLDICNQTAQQKNQTLLFLNNTKEESSLGEYKTLLNGLKIASINSTTKDQAHHKEIAIEGNMSDYDVLLTTSVLKEGTSITKHSKTVSVIINLTVSQLHPVEVEQLCARFRKAEKLNLYILINDKYEAKPSLFINKKQRHAEMERQGDEVISEWVKASLFQCKYDERQAMALERISGCGWIQKDNNGGYYNDQLLISNTIFQKETQILIQNIDNYIEYLSQYGFIQPNDNPTNRTNKISEETKSEISENKSVQKAEMEKRRDQFLTEIANEKVSVNAEAVAQKFVEHKEKSNLRYKINWINNNILLLDRYSHENNQQAIQLLTTYGFTEQAFTKITKQYWVQMMITNEKLIKKDVKKIKFFTAIFDNFEIGKRYAKDFINAELNKLQRIVFGAEVVEMSMKKSSQLFEMCFGVKTVALAGGKERVFEVENKNPLLVQVSTINAKQKEEIKWLETEANNLLDWVERG